MNKKYINKIKDKKIVISQDTYLYLGEEFDKDEVQIFIDNCNCEIIDQANIIRKTFNVKNSNVTIVQINDNVQNQSIDIINDGSKIEYNIIDLINDDLLCHIKQENIAIGSTNNINVGSVCYNGKNKKYIINTANLNKQTNNEITCFGIVQDTSSLNYDVTSFIKNGAKKSIVRQNSNILLFDKTSLGKNNPILVIEENDVKASHGSSIGKIDDDTMFYLCSRGLSKKDATNLICLGKMQYLINKIKDNSVKESLINKFKERM